MGAFFLGILILISFKFRLYSIVCLQTTTCDRKKAHQRLTLAQLVPNDI
jgi:hypothetical protein